MKIPSNKEREVTVTGQAGDGREDALLLGPSHGMWTPLETQGKAV